MKKIYYWHDAKNDDFASTDIHTKKIPADYCYFSTNPFYLTAELLLRLIALPIIFLIMKIGYLQRFRNKKVLKQAKGKGYFIYGNHTDYMMDAYNPSLLTCPRKAHIIVNADAVSIKGLATIVKMLGALPLPTSIKGLVSFRDNVNLLLKRKRVIAIYPEAHIWPHYTDIRPFGTQSFHYPVDADVPSFAFTNIYVQRKLKFIKAAKVVTYVDGPFYPDKTLPRSEQIQKLRDDIYSAMKKRVDENPKYDTCEYIYVDSPEKTNAKNKKTDEKKEA